MIARFWRLVASVVWHITGGWFSRWVWAREVWVWAAGNGWWASERDDMRGAGLWPLGPCPERK